MEIYAIIVYILFAVIFVGRARPKDGILGIVVALFLAAIAGTIVIFATLLVFG